MRFEKGHKERTRGHILDTASRRLREDGIAASGIAAIMADAGLTNGAFYVHFESKEALVREALAAALAHQRDKLHADSGDLETVVRSYLNLAHVAEPNSGCPSAALLPEIGRQPLSTRKTYETGLLEYLKAVASYLPCPESPAATRRAMAIFSGMVGALQLARAVADQGLATSLLEEGVAAALALAALPLSPPEEAASALAPRREPRSSRVRR